MLRNFRGSHWEIVGYDEADQHYHFQDHQKQGTGKEVKQIWKGVSTMPKINGDFFGLKQ